MEKKRKIILISQDFIEKWFRVDILAIFHQRNNGRQLLFKAFFDMMDIFVSVQC